MVTDRQTSVCQTVRHTNIHTNKQSDAMSVTLSLCQDDAGAAGDDAPRESEIKTKSEFYKVFGQAGPTKMVHQFMQDRTLQLHAIVLTEVALPLEANYYEELRQTAEGIEAQKALAAGRANFDWLQTIFDTLEVPTQKAFMSRLGLTKPLQPPLDYAFAESDLEWAKAEMDIVNLAHTFAFHLASHVCWANMTFSEALPHAAAVYLHNCPDVRKHRVGKLSQMIECLLSVEQQVIIQNKSDTTLAECLRDVGFHLHQLARYTLVLASQSGYDPNCPLMMELMELLYAGSGTTKELLESTFAFLHRKVQQHTAGKRMADETKYAYAALSPYPKAGGVGVIRPSAEDFDFVLSEHGADSRMWASKHLFQPHTTPMPDDGTKIKPSDIFESRDEWKPSGSLSHQTTVAALRYLMADRVNLWANSDNAWIGPNAQIKV